MNHSTITGPKTAPRRAVPVRWIANSATRMITAIGTMNGCSAGAMTPRPSTAPSTVIAGVIIPSP
jgi:hypothetical protein